MIGFAEKLELFFRSKGELIGVDLHIEWGTMIYQLILFFILSAIIIGIPCLLIIQFYKGRKRCIADYEKLEQRVRQLEEELRK